MVLGIEQKFDYCLQVRPVHSSDVYLPQSVAHVNDILCFFFKYSSSSTGKLKDKA